LEKSNFLKNVRSKKCSNFKNIHSKKYSNFGKRYSKKLCSKNYFKKDKKFKIPE
jgi:hypothetical protein